MLRVLAEGIQTRSGDAPNRTTIVRVLDRIADDPELSARLDQLDEDGVRSEFLALYEAEASRER